MTQWLEEFGDQIEVVFANNDDMALGAIDACLAAEMDPLPFVVGVDATPPALEAVAEGTLQGTVLNDAQGQAREMLDLPVTWRRERRRRWRTATMSGWSTPRSPGRRWKRHPPERKAKGNKDTGPGTHCVPGPVLCVYGRKTSRNPGWFRPVRADRGPPAAAW